MDSRCYNESQLWALHAPQAVSFPATGYIANEYFELPRTPPHIGDFDLTNQPIPPKKDPMLLQHNFPYKIYDPNAKLSPDERSILRSEGRAYLNRIYNTAWQFAVTPSRELAQSVVYNLDAFFDVCRCEDNVWEGKAYCLYHTISVSNGVDGVDSQLSSLLEMRYRESFSKPQSKCGACLRAETWARETLVLTIEDIYQMIMANRIVSPTLTADIWERAILLKVMSVTCLGIEVTPYQDGSKPHVPHSQWGLHQASSFKVPDLRIGLEVSNLIVENIHPGTPYELLPMALYPREEQVLPARFSDSNLSQKLHPGMGNTCWEEYIARVRDLWKRKNTGDIAMVSQAKIRKSPEEIDAFDKERGGKRRKVDQFRSSNSAVPKGVQPSMLQHYLQYQHFWNEIIDLHAKKEYARFIHAEQEDTSREAFCGLESLQVNIAPSTGFSPKQDSLANERDPYQPYCGTQTLIPSNHAVPAAGQMVLSPLPVPMVPAPQHRFVTPQASLALLPATLPPRMPSNDVQGRSPAATDAWSDVQHCRVTRPRPPTQVPAVAQRRKITPHTSTLTSAIVPASIHPQEVHIPLPGQATLAWPPTPVAAVELSSESTQNVLSPCLTPDSTSSPEGEQAINDAINESSAQVDSVLLPTPEVSRKSKVPQSLESDPISIDAALDVTLRNIQTLFDEFVVDWRTEQTAPKDPLRD